MGRSGRVVAVINIWRLYIFGITYAKIQKTISTLEDVEF